MTELFINFVDGTRAHPFTFDGLQLLFPGTGFGVFSPLLKSVIERVLPVCGWVVRNGGWAVQVLPAQRVPRNLHA